MPVSVRYYLFSADEFARISSRQMSALNRRNDALPQYAQTKQKIATAKYQTEGGRAVELIDVEGSYLSFNKSGNVTDRLVGNLSADRQAHVNLDADETGAPSTKNDDDPQLSKEEWHRIYRWTPSQDELALITDDIFNRRPAPLLSGDVRSEKREQLSGRDKRAMNEIESTLYSLTSQLTKLSRESLINICDAARQKHLNELQPLWLGVANAGDRYRDILERYRTGAGIWYASITIVKWNRARDYGRSDIVAYRECHSKSEAEAAVRLLLAENAKHFTVENTVEAHVVCDLEWDY